MKGLQNMSYKKEKTPKILLDNKSICILPWIHTSVKPNSEAKPCCRFQHYLPEHKDIKKVNVIDYKTPQEILNSDAYKNLREKCYVESLYQDVANVTEKKQDRATV